VRALALPPGDWRLVIGGAVLTCAAYPPFHLFLPSFLCLIPAAWLILDGADDPRPVRRHLAQGFWFGLVANGLLLHWMVVALWHFTPLSVLGYAGTVIGLAVYSAVLFAVTGWVMRTTRLSLLFVFPVLWTALEWIVGHQGDFRFPWLGLGTSLTGYPTAVQLADIVGARGVTWLLVLANVALALAWRHRAARRQAAVLAGGVGLGLVVALLYGVVRERTLDLRAAGKVTVVQPNIGYEEKWEQAQQDSIVNGLLNLTAEALMAEEPLLEGTELRDPDLVVWPEAAVPGYFQQNPVWLVLVKEFSATTRTSILLGALDFAQTEDGRVEFYNAAYLFNDWGVWNRYPVYHKRYLVPITERVPIAGPRWIRSRFFGGFTPGTALPVYEPRKRGSDRTLHFGVLICYESAFEKLARGYRRGGAEFLVNITNDAWFGRTLGPYQHAAHLVMRAIENRVGIARAANSGISAFVDPLGREHQRTALEVRTFETREILTAEGLTLYTRLGDWAGTLSLLATALLVGYAWWRRR
jgi:apolipoprotein N-acyltransferase